jgi:hypothetical protein
MMTFVAEQKNELVVELPRHTCTCARCKCWRPNGKKGHTPGSLPKINPKDL